MYAHDPGNRDKLETIYVFLSVDDHGNRGICATIMPGLGSTPLVTGSLKVVEAWKAAAAELAAMTGKKIELRQFNIGEKIWASDTPVARPLDIS